MMNQSGRYRMPASLLPFIGVLLALSLAIAPIVQAHPDETPISQPAASERDSRTPHEPDDVHDDAGEPKPHEREADATDAEEEPAEEKRPLTEQERLVKEVNALIEELRRLRQELAEARLARSEMHRELTELRQFIDDHHEYGRDFEEYQRLRKIKEREQQRREQREARERYLREREERMQQQEIIRQTRVERRAAERQEREFRQRGFEPLGMDVFLGRMAYQYRIRDTLRTRVIFDPYFGFFTQRDLRDRIDYTEMIISGAVINASDEVRNLGIAITFFDEVGNQVGHEIIQVNYARPGVPYPFTSTVGMALDRPFTTSSSYVLFADRAELD